MGKTVLRAEGLTKTYWKPGGSGEKGTFIDVLKNVSFEMKEGQVMGLIGGNGAGKSTLLKILSRIIAPSAGKVTYEGPATAILEIGTGFHPDLSGRENIFFSGALLGASRAEVKRQMDAIIDFSGIAEFIDTPIKHYSAGMYLRLAFSTAFHFPVKLLFLDEVIVVGDAEFRMKSREKLEELVRNGATVMVASHQINEIQYLTQETLYLQKGELITQGPTQDVIEAYIGSLPAFSGVKIPELDNEFLQLLHLEVRAQGKSQGEAIFMHDAIEIVVRFKKKTPQHAMEVGIHIYEMGDFRIMMDSIGLKPGYQPTDMPAGIYESKVTIPPSTLNRGYYSFWLNFSQDAIHHVADVPRAGNFRVEVTPNSKMDSLPMLLDAPIMMRLQWEVREVKSEK